jgi:hypothetical protein
MRFVSMLVVCSAAMVVTRQAWWQPGSLSIRPKPNSLLASRFFTERPAAMHVTSRKPMIMLLRSSLAQMLLRRLAHLFCVWSVHGGVAQTFATMVGQVYRVTFDLAGSPGNGPADKQVEVSAADLSGIYAY